VRTQQRQVTSMEAGLETRFDGNPLHFRILTGYAGLCRQQCTGGEGSGVRGHPPLKHHSPQHQTLPHFRARARARVRACAPARVRARAHTSTTQHLPSRLRGFAASREPQSPPLTVN